ncbi:hypothetical protein [Clostridium algidicarnis]|uniref:hypothetical protein n=1 Tax=Clostridium algidicarnis TaxID=37659 RepID=UPI00384A4EDB
MIARYNFEPTKLWRENLLKEVKEANLIYVTGNTVIDTFKIKIREDYTHEKLK